jgi:polysaccharide export outer membrane protein
MKRIAWCLVLALLSSTVLTSPAPCAEPAYVIGVDDVLGISVWDNKDLDQVVFVLPDGKISLPLLGEVQAGGQTVAALASTLTEMYSQTVKGAAVTVTVREIRSRPVFFVGGVGRATPMQLTQEMTLLQAIAAAGGVAPAANVESAYVMRGDERIPVDFVRLIQKGDVTQNIKIRPGDTIVVPLADVVYVQGEVRAPGTVKYVKDLTMVMAMAQVGGFTPLAAPKRVLLLRTDGEKKENIRVNVSELMNEPETAKDLLLRPNDIIIVPQRLF